MEHNEQKGKARGAFSTLLSWLGMTEKVEDQACALPEDVGETGNGDESPCVSSNLEGMSPNAQAITHKILTLRKALEFESSLGEKLKSIVDSRQLLLFIQEAFLFRFDQLRKIGLVSQESHRFIESLGEKAALLASTDKIDDASGPNSPAELKRENAELKQRIEVIHAKYAKAGVISDADVARDREIARLSARVRDQRSQLKIAKKRLDVLASYQEMIQTLRVRNGFLASKAEQQAKLLRSLTMSNPQHEKLLSEVNKLTEENKQLKSDLERQSHLLHQIREHIPSEARVVVDELLKRNTALREDMEDKEGQIDAVISVGGSLHDQLDQLQERNYRLKRTLETTRTLDRFMQESQDGSGDYGPIVEALKAENECLQRALNVKEDQLKTAKADPASRQLMAAYSRLQQDYRQVFKENQVKEKLYRQELTQKEDLMSQVRERTALIKENQRLKVELESARRIAQSLKRSEPQIVQLKKDKAELETRCQRVTVELDEAKRKLDRVMAEYKVLMSEYENIFGRQ